jgi:serine phosphatase RsbU (regulator of sigma subunit)
VVVPVKVGTEVLGVLTLSGTVDRGPLQPGAVLAAEQIAERAAVALQKARSFAEEREVASLMQRALLPDSQRSVEGHEVGTCYVPAAVGREIGGDWWDVLRLPDGRFALIVGDVSGHGVHVAPSMAKLRHSIDGVLTHGASPAEAVTAASRLLEVNRPGSYATAFVSVFDPTSRDLVYSRAGHPPPLLVLPDEVVSLDHPGGTLLGLNMAERSDTTITLPEHFELVAFTDGLVEEPGLAYDDGIDRLVRAVRALPHDLVGQARAERLVADVVGATGRDDVCVVMVRPESTPAADHDPSDGTPRAP